MKLSERDFEMAPCLRDGPLAEPGCRLVQAARSLGESRFATIVRAWTVPFVYDAMADIFARDQEHPTPLVAAMFNRLGEMLEIQARIQWSKPADSAPPPAIGDDFEQRTAQHFGSLFEEFSTEAFWQRPAEQLRVRLERNDLSLSCFEGKDILDAGCGSGRMSLVFGKLGAKSVAGVDISETCLATARKRMQHLGANGMQFMQGSVLDLPYDESSFDVVFSFGVLHHTGNWHKGITEMLRVLRPGGVGLIMYLNEKPGGLFWDLLEVLRVIMAGEDPSLVRASLSLLGIQPERIIQMLDPALVPINERLSPDDIAAHLGDQGTTDIRRFARGTDSDRIEKVYQKLPYAEVKYGIGENRYVFYKP